MIKSLARYIFSKAGLTVSRTVPDNNAQSRRPEFPIDYEEAYIEIIKKTRGYTLTSHEKLYQLIGIVKYLIDNKISGDFVECGVWRGGSILAMIETLKLLKVDHIKIHLFDTFSVNDMLETTAAIEEDKPFESSGPVSLEQLSVDLESVKKLMRSTGYPQENIIFHVGRVEDTIPKSSIDSIALLRLDTDWYDSTRLQLESFYHKVENNGVVISDDYGYWEGHKKAVDEFLANNKLKPLLVRNDHACRFFIKNI